MRRRYPEILTDVSEERRDPEEWILTDQVQGNIAITSILIFKKEQTPDCDTNHYTKIRKIKNDHAPELLFPFSIRNEPKQYHSNEFHEVKVFHRQQVDDRKGKCGNGQPKRFSPSLRFVFATAPLTVVPMLFGSANGKDR